MCCVLRFERSARAGKKGITIAAVGQPTPEETAQLAQALAEERVRYEALKREFQVSMDCWKLCCESLKGHGLSNGECPMDPPDRSKEPCSSLFVLVDAHL